MVDIAAVVTEARVDGLIVSNTTGTAQRCARDAAHAHA